MDEIGGIDGLMQQIWGYLLAGFLTFTGAYGLSSILYRVKSDETLYLETEEGNQGNPSNVRAIKLGFFD